MLLRGSPVALSGLDLDGEPELIVWGHLLEQTTVAPLSELKTALDQLEDTTGQQTEPDIILRVPGWGWIFVEAKLGSPTSTYNGRPDKLEGWKNRYAKADVALVRQTYAEAVENWADDYLADESVITRSATWEQIYALTEAQLELSDLRGYLADKSVNLRKAFEI